MKFNITKLDKLMAFAFAFGLAAYFSANAAFATGSNDCKKTWCINEQSQTQSQGQEQTQSQSSESRSNSSAWGGDASVGNTTATTGDSNAIANAGDSYSAGGSVANSGNSRSQSSVSDSGNSSVHDSGNSSTSVTNIINHRYPITLTPPSVIDGQQGSQIYTELHGVSVVLKNKPVLFISELATADKAEAITKCGVIDSRSEHGKAKLGVIKWSGSQYKSPIEVTKKLAGRAPAGTNQIIALVATGYHNRGGALSGGAGEMNAAGITKMLTASLSGGAVFPFPIVRAYYCENELEAR